MVCVLDMSYTMNFLNRLIADPQYIYLGIGTKGANTQGFQGSVPLLPHLCPLSIP